LGADIEIERVPRSAVMARFAASALGREALLAGGDDYELCFTASPRRRPRIVSLSARLRLPLSRIGTMRPGRGVRVLDPNGNVLALSRRGFDHFG
jgi:thiamine-monophosphate kinase